MSNQVSEEKISKTFEKMEKNIISWLRASKKHRPNKDTAELAEALELQVKEVYKLLPDDSKNRIKSLFPEVNFV